MRDEDLMVDALLLHLAEGQFERVANMFLPQLRPLVSAAAIAHAWRDAVGEGDIVPGPPDRHEVRAGIAELHIPLRTGGGEATLILSFAGQFLAALHIVTGRVAKSQPDWRPPDYAQPDLFEEVDCSLGPPPLDTPATLSLPRGAAGLLPAVLLLPGSGPVDQDGTVGHVKPLKDIAWGLASRGIAVLRFDKISHSRPGFLSRNGHATVADEYLRHAELGIALLRAQGRVDPKRLFLLGHSFGGGVAVRLAQRHADLAGVIILAGAALPLHHALMRQVGRNAAAAGMANPSEDAVTATLAEQIRRVDGRDLTLSTPPADLPLGLPASYWLDIRDFRPAPLAAVLPQPLLLLQGARDEQCTVAEDFAEWTAALMHRPDVETHILPDDNHLFMPTHLPDNSQEVRSDQVDPEVIRICSRWINKA